MSVSQLLLQLVGQMLQSCINHVDTSGCDSVCYTQRYIITCVFVNYLYFTAT